MTSIWVMVGFFVAALLGMLIFGITLVATGVVTISGSAWAFLGKDKRTGVSPMEVPEKRNNLFGKLGLAVAGGGTIALLAFGSAFISMIGFICSVVVNMIIWIPRLFALFQF